VAKNEDSGCFRIGVKFHLFFSNFSMSNINFPLIVYDSINFIFIKADKKRKNIKNPI